MIRRGISKIYAKGAIVWRSIEKPFETLTEIENKISKYVR